MASDAISRIQRALRDKGCDPGEIDGLWGRKTIAAVMRFQQQAGLEADGVVGPLTSKALFGDAPAASTPMANSGAVLTWFEEAKRLIGTKEIGGSMSNPTILDWAANLDISYPNDDIPWCGLFVAHCIGSTLPGEPLPSNPLGARNWRNFGDPTDPRLGAVLVFWRGSREGFQGHVGFYNGENANAYQVLGGNQSNSVSLAWVAKDRLLGARWPHSARSLTSKTVQQQQNGGLSTNEA